MRTSTAELAASSANDVILGTEAGWRSVHLRPTYVIECHYCGFQVADPPPPVCPKCRGSTWDRFVRPGSLLGRTQSTPGRGRVRRATSIDRCFVSLRLRARIRRSNGSQSPPDPSPPMTAGPAMDA
jgi:hypothetical protein